MFRNLVLFLIGLAGMIFGIELYRSKKSGINLKELSKKDYNTVKGKAIKVAGVLIKKMGAYAGILAKKINEMKKVDVKCCICKKDITGDVHKDSRGTLCHNCSTLPIVISGNEIKEKGTVIGMWPCDWNPATEQVESNASDEYLILYNDKYYSVSEAKKGVFKATEEVNACGLVGEWIRRYEAGDGSIPFKGGE